MRLYITAISPNEHLYIDCIYIIRKDGKEIKVDWDETDYSYEKGEYCSRHKGVYFDDEYANGKIKEIHDAKLGEVIFGWNGKDEELDNLDDSFKITSIVFEDCDKTLSFTNDQMVQIVAR